MKTTHYYFILKQLQEIDLIIEDLSIYLEASPDDSKALLQINHYYLERKKLVDLYESKYGPYLLSNNYSSSNTSSTINIPWYWYI